MLYLLEKMAKNVVKTTNKEMLSDAELNLLIPNFKKIPLTNGEARFVHAYMQNGRNAINAYRDSLARPNARENALKAGAGKMLRSPDIQEGIKRYTTKIIDERKDVLEFSILDVLWNQAFYDPAELMATNGAPKFQEWDEVPIGLRWCVEGIETKVQFNRDGDRVDTTHIKLANRKEALRELANYVGMMNNASANLNMSISGDTQMMLQAIFNNNKAAATPGVHQEGAGRRRNKEATPQQPKRLKGL